MKKALDKAEDADLGNSQLVKKLRARLREMEKARSKAALEEEAAPADAVPSLDDEEMKRLRDEKMKKASNAKFQCVWGGGGRVLCAVCPPRPRVSHPLAPPPPPPTPSQLHPVLQDPQPRRLRQVGAVHQQEEGEGGAAAVAVVHHPHLHPGLRQQGLRQAGHPPAQVHPRLLRRQDHVLPRHPRAGHPRQGAGGGGPGGRDLHPAVQAVLVQPQAGVRGARVAALLHVRGHLPPLPRL